MRNTETSATDYGGFLPSSWRQRSKPNVEIDASQSYEKVFSFSFNAIFQRSTVGTAANIVWSLRTTSCSVLGSCAGNVSKWSRYFCTDYCKCFFRMFTYIVWSLCSAGLIHYPSRTIGYHSKEWGWFAVFRIPLELVCVGCTIFGFHINRPSVMALVDKYRVLSVVVQRGPVKKTIAAVVETSGGHGSVTWNKVILLQQ